MSIRNIDKNLIYNNSLVQENIRDNYNPSPAWKRNPAWPSLTDPSSSEDKIVGLFAVYPGDSTGTNGNWLISRLYTASSNINVDFGDGTTSNNVSSSTIIYHDYDFDSSSLYDATVTFTDSGDLVTRNSHGYENGDIVSFYRISSTTGITEDVEYYVINATQNTFQISTSDGGSPVALTTNGSASLLPYKIATVTYTLATQSGYITTVNFTELYGISASGSIFSVTRTVSGWLDLSISAPSATTIRLGTSSYNVYHPLLEKVTIISSNVQSTNYMFTGLNRLQNVILTENSFGTVTNARDMFRECGSLEYPPYFDTSSVTDATTMFYNCYSLKEVPLYDFSSVTTASNIFGYNYSLKKIPKFDFSSCTNLTSAFQQCHSVKSIDINAPKATNFQFTFSYCYNLKTAKVNCPLLQTLNYGFYQCYSLVKCELTTSSSLTSTTRAFYLNIGLRDVYISNTSSVNYMDYMFYGCRTLQKGPVMDTSSVISAYNMFEQGYSLESVPLYDFSSLQNANYMFRYCYTLNTIPQFDFSSILYLQDMFRSCYSLKSIPEINVSNMSTSQNITYLVSECHSLQTMKMTGLKLSFTLYGRLSASAIDEVYTNLPSVSGRTITLHSQIPGITSDNTSIATAKGWTVSG
jgi:hypothetical protein